MAVSPIVISFAGDFSRLRRDMKKAERQAKGFSGKLAAGVKAAALPAAAALAGLGATAVKAAKEYGEFDKGVREVATLLGDVTAPQVEALGDSIRAVAVEFGQGTEEVSKAFYDSISAGVATADTVQSFAEDAARFAAAGATDIGTGVDLLTSAINAYGLSAADAGKVSDTMFSTVRAGKTTVAELAASFSQVGPVAASAGVGLEEVMGWVAQLTLSGTPTAQAMTQIRGALSELLNPSKKLAKEFHAIAGQTFQQFIASGGTLQEALGLISQRADATGKGMTEMTSRIEGAMALLGATGENADRFASTLANVGDSAGATGTAFETMADGAGYQMDQFNAAMKELRLEIGEQVVPVLLELLPVIKDVATNFVGLFKSLADGIKATHKFAEENQGLTEAMSGVSEEEEEMAAKAWDVVKSLFGMEEQAVKTTTAVAGMGHGARQTAEAFDWAARANAYNAAKQTQIIANNYRQQLRASVDYYRAVGDTERAQNIERIRMRSIVADAERQLVAEVTEFAREWESASAKKVKAVKEVAEAVEETTEEIADDFDHEAQLVTDHFIQLSADVAQAHRNICGELEAVTVCMDGMERRISVDAAEVAHSFGYLGGDIVEESRNICGELESITVCMDGVATVIDAKTGEIIEDVKDMARSSKDEIRDLERTIAELEERLAVRAATTQIAETFRGDINSVEYAQWQQLAAVRAAQSGGSLRGGTQLVVPGFASGGIVTRPTLAVVGEAGPEAIVPLSGGRGMGGVTINVQAGPLTTASETAEAIEEMLVSLQARKGSLEFM